MQRIYLIRHGQSVLNFSKRHSGWSMLPLTEKGFEDARRAGEKLKDIPFDRIYSSPLIRAVQTAEQIAQMQAAAGRGRKAPGDLRAHASISGLRIPLDFFSPSGIRI